MTYTYEILLKARKELLEAWEWYEDRQDGLGDRFKSQVYQKIEQLVKTPDRYPERKKSFREVKIDVFPYLLIYKIARRKKVVTIVSIFHTSRNPHKKYSSK
ncbi:type II toxin-antitoxin system RelE/ParE family toxin [Niabella aquatica]